MIGFLKKKTNLGKSCDEGQVSIFQVDKRCLFNATMSLFSMQM